jgi:hypothetical protein
MSDTAIYLGPTLNREVAKSILKAEARGDFMCVLGGDKLLGYRRGRDPGRRFYSVILSELPILGRGRQ